MPYSEAGFGARLENAQQILTHLQTFEDYIPSSEELSIDRFEELIKVAKKYDELAKNTIDDYTKTVSARENLFRNDTNSFMKLLPSINAAIRSKFGRDSQQYENTASMVRNVRGIRLTKLSKDPNATTISQSESSYGSLVNALSGIIIVFEKYGSAYNPGNPTIQLDALKTLHTNMEAANKAVTSTLGIQSNTRNLRTKTFDTLHSISQRIKDGVRSQYTPSSNQYKLIKNLTA